MLVIFGGLPGTGKTTIAREVARSCRATYLRIDAIEQAVRSAGVLANDIGTAGYLAGYALAEANLKLGHLVLADCVNPLAVTRSAWRAVAAAASAPLLDVEIVCSDPREHRRRVETRAVDLPGLRPPTWEEIRGRDYDPRSDARLVLDTALLSAAAAAAAVCARIAAQRQPVGKDLGA